MRVCFGWGGCEILLFLLLWFLWVVALLLAWWFWVWVFWVVAFKWCGCLLCFGWWVGVVLCLAYCGLGWFALFVGSDLLCLCVFVGWCCLFVYYGWLFARLIWFVV